MRNSLFFGVIALMLVGCGSPELNELSSETSRGSALDYDSYRVRFTNPQCRTYEYRGAVYSNSGDRLYQKPKNTYCKHSDARNSGRQYHSPQRELIRWIEDRSTREIFMAYLSYSNTTVNRALCAAADRGVKITFVLHRSTELSLAERLSRCGRGESRPRIVERGGEGGIGYAHNKVFIVNPDSSLVKIAFSSGNMSSGVVLHHENWHFVTLSANSYFAQAHLCLREGLLEKGRSARSYSSYIEQCRRDIPHDPESDIRTFFVPGEGDDAMQTIRSALRNSESVDIAAHRFSNTDLIGALTSRRSLRGSRFIADDDMYWAGKGVNAGENTRSEYRNADRLIDKGIQAKWMETNHEHRLLHHNKFLIFNGRTPAVFTGAGNLTNAAFSRNYENFYFIEIPFVVEDFQEQYDHMWEKLATSEKDMPRENALP